VRETPGQSPGHLTLTGRRPGATEGTPCKVLKSNWNSAGLAASDW
jgi:hypothetical protein